MAISFWTFQLRVTSIIGTSIIGTSWVGADNVDYRVIDHRMGFIKNIDNRKHILIIIGAGGLGLAFWGVLDWLVPPSIPYESTEGRQDVCPKHVLGDMLGDRTMPGQS